MSDEKKSPWWSKAQALAERLGTSVSENAQKLADEAAQGEAWKQVKAATESVKTSARRAAENAGEKAQQAGATAQKIAQCLLTASQTIDEPQILVAQTLEALSGLKGQLDTHAQAVAVGFLKGGGIGAQDLDGLQVLYLRPDGPIRAHLRVSQIQARFVRLALGASAGAYVACLYGDREALAQPMTWRGGDAGLWVASVALFKAESNRTEKKAAGWWMSVSAGLGLGVPLLSELGGFVTKEQLIGGAKLEHQLSEPLEALLAEAPDRARLRAVASKLAGR